ncbi:5-oxoprolinase subunit PxpB [Alkaliphilus hydrothermalis]|uniref:KipI family sensor histidine kinase inhibitor n=1 Tax=Alkaliphilus hydrothermalis TaxID=1482730 RepID=A0ABS2NKQ2_9FIRM|nr:5-oxoprolinase subunit PxpB [Alkaliphilus hydrothermalis]MBM7613504.1 KipI family sensor histidine kinase inhibitor [Alkaliphilus hydrothermalis]
MELKFNFFPAGDNGIILQLGENISKEINGKIRRIVYWINESKDEFKEVIEVVPTYTTILIIYDPLQSSYGQLVRKLQAVGKLGRGQQLPPARIIHVPVVYGGDFGPDLAFVAEHNNLSEAEVIQLHKSEKYLIYMIGFTPGFPYLGGMRKEIATPRLKVPREKISAGAVGIAGNQTGIYPIESPGGWQLIGRTPLDLFNPYREPAVLFQAGDYIKFVEITRDEYIRIEDEVKQGTYHLKMSY